MKAPNTVEIETRTVPDKSARVKDIWIDSDWFLADMAPNPYAMVAECLLKDEIANEILVGALSDGTAILLNGKPVDHQELRNYLAVLDEQAEIQRHTGMAGLVGRLAGRL
jgi:hypothetical protein